MQECSLYSEGEFIMKSNNIRRIFLSSVSIVLMAVVVGCTNEKKEDNISSLATSTTSISSSDLSIPSSSTPTNNITPTQSPSNSPTTTPDTSQIESELEAELESIIESTNPADITDTPVQIDEETQQENSASSVPSGGQTQTPSGNQGNAGQTQTLSGTQGTPSQDTEVKQPDKQTQQNGTANNQGTTGNQESAGTGTGSSPVNVGDPGYNPNYISPVTGVILDQNHNGIPDPLEIGTGSKVVSDDWSNYDWH